jgi:hypothetical protein
VRHSIRELFEEIAHRSDSNGRHRSGSDERTAHEKILDSLEWEDTDSGKDLEERGGLAEDAKREELVG